MFLNKINFSENKSQPNFWEIKDLYFNQFNLVAGLNATGKTRLVNVISNLGKILTKKIKVVHNANWDLEFKTEKNDIYEYHLIIQNKIVTKEKILRNKKILLDRRKNTCKIYSELSNELINISPPETEFVFNVRRDLKEFSFLEDLYNWADSIHGYKFTSARPDEIIIPMGHKIEGQLEDLGATPILLQKSIKNTKNVKKIISDFNSLGYKISQLDIRNVMIPGVPNPALLTFLREDDLNCDIDQRMMSQGMYRALSLVVIINYILSINKPCTLLIDDLGEGLDYTRATNLAQLLINKLQNTKIQLIMTSNDRFLINSINLKYLNLLERHGHTVTAFNYQNNKEQFDEFEYTGLNNFDLFSGRLYETDKGNN